MHKSQLYLLDSYTRSQSFEWRHKMSFTGDSVSRAIFVLLRGAFHSPEEINHPRCFTTVFVLSVGQKISWPLLWGLTFDQIEGIQKITHPGRCREFCWPFFCRGVSVPCVGFVHRPPDKGLLREVEEGACFKRGRSFHLWSLMVNQFCLSVGKESSIHGRAEWRWKMWFVSVAGWAFLSPKRCKHRKQKHRPTSESQSFLKEAAEFVMTYLYTEGCGSPAHYFRVKNSEHEQMCHFRKEMSKSSINMPHRMSVFLKWPHASVTLLRLSQEYNHLNYSCDS